MPIILASKTHQLLVVEGNAIVIVWLRVLQAYRVGSPVFLKIVGIAVLDSVRRTGVGRLIVAQPKQWAAALSMIPKVRCH